MAQQKETHAIVIGGGIAGLLAVRVLTEHFAQVTLLERDLYPEAPDFRPGVPQGHHVHTMLLRGQQSVERWFPGIKEKLLAYGAVERAYGAESLYFYGGGRCPRLPPILRGWNCSRLLLEFVIRQELQTLPSVEIREGMEVIHLLSDCGMVCGVQYRERNEHALTNPLQEIHGELVVDASGMDSPIGAWLQEIGYQQPREEVIDARLGYATRLYRSPEDWKGWKGIAIQGQGAQRRGGTVMEIEGGRWMVVLAGSSEYPPTDDEGYMAFARSLPDPALYEAVCAAQPLSTIYGYRRTANRRRRFDQLSHVPAGLVVIGDALCTFNPVYGQGMTVASLEAEALDACLRSHVRGQVLARRFYKRAARVLAFPWRLAAGADARSGETRKGFRYIDAFVALLPYNKDALLVFLSVLHMIRSPLALFSPPLAVKVIRQWRRSGMRATT